MDEVLPESATAAPQVPLEDWPVRPWLLAGIGATAGLIVHLILTAEGDGGLGAAAAAFVFFAALAAGFVLRPRGWLEASLFALGLGLVMGGVAWLAVDSGDHMAAEEFAFAAGVFFSLLAVPLFQAGFHRQRWATSYSESHFHVWTDAVSAGGAVLFVQLSWLLLWLMHALFSLIGIEVIEDLIQTDGFAGSFIGATFGAAMGVLRNQLHIIGTLQRVVMLVFSLLAVPFALGIMLFLVILLVTGGNALWDATDSATPVLLACALGGFILCNAVVRDDDEARSGNLVMQAAALVLAASIFPLTVFAAISMGIRVNQYGLSPERLWALVAIAVATAYGLAYWVGIARGRMARWMHYLRRANLHLAVATCGVALVLALPLLDFGRISAANQIARLDAGKVSAEEFDFTALRWDFGDAGRRALARLAEGEGEVAELAQAAQAQTERPYGWYGEGPRREDAEINLRVQPEDPDVRAFVVERLRHESWRCREYCLALDLGENAAGQRQIALVEGGSYEVMTMADGDPAVPPEAREYPSLGEDSVVELRTVPRRYVFIDGQPVGGPVEEQGAGAPPAIEIAPTVSE